MREGSLEAPVRHPLAWQDAEFWDEEKLDAEMRRVLDICHGCRRCFNLCDSFPRLFDLVDNAPSEELDTVDSKDFKQVVDACTLCDLCFMTKCPYVPPHEFNLDFPHLMLRYRAVEARKNGLAWTERQLKETDRNGRLGTALAPLANWATDTGNGLARGVMEKVAGVDRRAALPRFNSKTFTRIARDNPPAVAAEGPAKGRKAVIYATCFANYNEPSIGTAALGVLARFGVETEVVYPRCCGMPQLENGEIARVAEAAREVAAALLPYVDKGYDIVALVPSCALMMKFEWPLLLPEDEQVKRLAQASFDISEYVVDLAKRHGMPAGAEALDGGVTLHIACHARAQNMGQKATEMLRLLPKTKVAVVERCSGHGGAWGVMKGNYEVALKVGKPVARQAVQAGNAHVASECPLAGVHILQGMDALAAEKGEPSKAPERAPHPIELFARALGVA